MKRLYFFLLLVTVSISSVAQREAAFEMNAQLGRGINMGNAFEAPTETAWGNPWQPQYFEMIADLGFQHVRLPIRWETPERSMAEAPYTINATFLQRIKEVVDKALENNLIIIINMHHHELLFADPDGQKQRFLSQWNQIATYFKDYPKELIFEVLNEPHGNLTPQKWNEFFAAALAEIRETNPDRMVLMGTAEFGGLSGIPYLQLPDDENIIVTVHYYNPFNFTHQGAEWVGTDADAWLGTEWMDTEAERESITGDFAATLAFSENHNVPVHVGEFGAYSKADLESRVRWTTYLARWFEMQNLSWAYWEFSAGFGIYDPAANQTIDVLVDALTKNEMPEPLPTEAVLIYQSNFANGVDGWSLNAQGGASASLAASSGRLQINISNGGTEAWHIQLTKNNVALYEDGMYKLTVKATASETRNVTFYAGKASDPWTSYSGYSQLTLSPQETTYSVSFTMSNPTDTQARIVMDLGTSDIDVQIIEIKLEEIKTVITSVVNFEPQDVRVYPNPVHTYLFISDPSVFNQAWVLDISGRIIEKLPLLSYPATINLEKYRTGQYIIHLINDKGKSRNFRILKN